MKLIVGKFINNCQTHILKINLMRKKQNHINYLYPLAFFLFICWIIYMANANINNIFFDLINMVPGGDKLGHFFLFGMLAMLVNLALNCRTFKFKKYNLQLGGSLIFILTIFEELSQHFFPNRTLDIVDLIANLAGILFFNYLSTRIAKTYALK